MTSQVPAPFPWPSHIKKILLIGTGAVGVALMPGWVMLLRGWYGVEIQILLTHSARQMVSTQVLAAVSNNPVCGPGWNKEFEGVEHKVLSEWADLILVAPATANYVTRLAQGNFEDISLYVPALTEAPVVLAPSLPGEIRNFPPVDQSLQELRKCGFHILENQGMSMVAHSHQAEQGGLVNIVDIAKYVWEKFGEEE